MTYIIDAHQDIAYNAITFGRDICKSAYEIRSLEKGTQTPVRNEGEAVVGWPEFQSGEIAVIFATIFMPPFSHRGGEWDMQAYQTTKEASKLYRKQIDFYNQLTEENPDKFKMILTKRDLNQVLQSWSEEPLNVSKPVGLTLLMEGAEGIESVDAVEEYYSLGLRQIGPVWSGTRFCGGTHEDRPFDNEGRKLLEVMSNLKMGLDISHMRESAALIALDLYDGAIIASHANSRTLLKGRSEERHLTDQVIRLLQERGGCIGVLPYNKFLSSDWVLSSPQETVTINHIVAQIDYYCQLAGNSTQVAMGSDFDGGFGYPNIPYPMESIKDLQLIKPALLAKGYSQQDVENIFNLNWKKYLERILPE